MYKRIAQQAVIANRTFNTELSLRVLSAKLSAACLLIISALSLTIKACFSSCNLVFSRKRPLIIRTDHKRDGTPYSYFMGWAFGKTDGLVAYGKRIMTSDMKTFGFPEERACVIPPAIKAYEGPVKNMKDEFGIKAEEKVIGVIGRLKPDRGYDIILQAFKELREHIDGVKLLIVGRSSQIEKSIMQPINELGTPLELIKAFGGKPQYELAIKELEQELYKKA